MVLQNSLHWHQVGHPYNSQGCTENTQKNQKHREEILAIKLQKLHSIGKQLQWKKVLNPQYEGYRCYTPSTKWIHHLPIHRKPEKSELGKNCFQFPLISFFFWVKISFRLNQFLDAPFEILWLYKSKLNYHHEPCVVCHITKLYARIWPLIILENLGAHSSQIPYISWQEAVVSLQNQKF